MWSRRAELAPRLTDIVWGDKDPAFTAQHLARWREAFPSALVARLQHTGHVVAEETPDAVITTLRARPRATA